MKFPISIFLLAGWVAFAQQQTSQTPYPQVDAIVNDAVQSGLIPGAVLIVGHNGEVVYRNAYGSRSLIPQREPMTIDTIFDAASLTKVIATTPSVMKLFEQGKLRLDDPVTKYLPEFQGGKSDITIRLLMTHFSGMPPDLVLTPRWSGYQTGIQRALGNQAVAPPGVRFIYSDINFILMGEIVRRLSGETLAQFAHEQIFAPLGMNETEFQPSAFAARPNRADRNRRRHGSAISGRGSRSDLALHGRHCGARGSIYHGRRSGQICRDDAGHGPAPRRADLRSDDGKEVYRAGESGRSADFARSRMGRGFTVLEQPRRTLPDRLVWAYRIYRNIHVDGPDDQLVRDSADQRGASQARKIAELAAIASGDRGGSVVRHRRTADGRAYRIQRDDHRRRRSSRGQSRSEDHDWA